MNNLEGSGEVCYQLFREVKGNLRRGKESSINAGYKIRGGEGAGGNRQIDSDILVLQVLKYSLKGICLRRVRKYL